MGRFPRVGEFFLSLVEDVHGKASLVVHFWADVPDLLSMGFPLSSVMELVVYKYSCDRGCHGGTILIK